MKKSLCLVIIVVAISALVLAACGGNTPESSQGTSQATPPSQYADLKNPNSTSGENAVEAGNTLFQTNCASCHGERGRGDGPAAASLDPKPADLVEKMGSLSDGYLYWRIAEGGQMAPFYSVMPAWKNLLSEEQIWQVITYLRSIGS